jgi:hypothetical protein
MVDRRNVVFWGGILLGLGGNTVIRAKVLAEPATEVGALRAVVTLGGREYVYEGVNSDDLGTYVGEFVQQRCFRVQRPDLPLTVFFRPDVSGDRVELVVELGRMWGMRPAHIVEPYSVVFMRGGTTLAKVEVPYHWWWARWRWQSSPRPIVRTGSSLIARGLLPPYGENAQLGQRMHQRVYSYEQPMDLAGLVPDWGGVGERDEIGPLTEPQADYIIHGTRSALGSLIAQAEACGSASIHWRDEKTGAFLDFQRYSGASINKFDGSPVIPNPDAPRDNGKQDRRFFLVETSHTPALAYLPFLLTDDPYYLEELQALGSLAIGFSAWFRKLYHLPGLASPHQTRSFAWSMRSLFQLGVVSPEKPPRWLLPRSYWRTCIANSRAFMQLYMESPARIHRYFRVFPGGAMNAGWMNSMLGFILSWGVTLGYREWRDAYEWFMGGTIAQCNGHSGWSRQWPVPYHWYPVRTWRAHVTEHLFQDSTIDKETCTDWSDAWSFFKSEEKIDDSGWDGHSIMETFKGPAYFLYLQASLRMAARLEVPNAQECSKWLDEELLVNPNYHRGSNFAKWSILPA